MALLGHHTRGHFLVPYCWRQIAKYGGPQLPRQNKITHGKIKSLTAK